MRIKAILFLTLPLLMACTKHDHSASNEAPDESKTHFVLADGVEKGVDVYKGEWLLVNYWAEWCKPCIKEIPELNAVNKQDGITVLGFNFDRAEGEALEQKLTQLDVQFTAITNDPAALFGEASPKALPATIVVSPEGKFVKWLLGPQTQDSIMAELEVLKTASAKASADLASL